MCKLSLFLKEKNGIDQVRKRLRGEGTNTCEYENLGRSCVPEDFDGSHGHCSENAWGLGEKK